MTSDRLLFAVEEFDTRLLEHEKHVIDMVLALYKSPEAVHDTSKLVLNSRDILAAAYHRAVKELEDVQEEQQEEE